MRFFREVNERAYEPWASGSEQRTAFVCECSNLGCRAPVFLSGDEYRLIRENPEHYIVVLDHIDPTNELVTASTGGYAVVACIEDRVVAVAGVD
jgi:hypothetical protein